jgi:hypothetical protein
VGRTLARAPEVGYIHEPFNIGGSSGVCAAPFRYWYTYVCDENGHEFARHLARTLSFRYELGAGLFDARSPRDILRTGRDAGAFLAHRARGARPLLKDPIAALSSDWLARTFAAEVVVVVRHPASFVGSLKIRGLDHPFDHFLAQPLLVRDHLRPLVDEIRRLAVRPADPVEQGTLLWRIVYGILRKYRRRHPEWTFVRHEDLCADPRGGRSKLDGPSLPRRGPLRAGGDRRPRRGVLRRGRLG